LAKFNSLGEAGCFGLGDIDGIATVVIGHVANVPSFFAMWCPGVMVGWAFMDDSLTSEGNEWAFVVAELTVQVFFSGEPGIQS
jgi:hypothetical protein